MNIALVAICSFQSAEVVNLVATDSLTPVPTYVGPAEATAEPERSDWEARKTILDRNLFGAKIVSEQSVIEPMVEEKVEETKLPLVLEATIAGSRPEDARAAILDTRSRSSSVLAVGDTLESSSHVKVAAIERRRVLLLNGGRPEELLLDEGPADENTRAAASSRTRGVPARSSRRARRPSNRSSARATAERLRQRNAAQPESQLTLEEITAEIERMRDLEQR